MNRILKFSAGWCGQCKTLDRQLQQLNIAYQSFDADEPSNEDLVNSYHIVTLPVLIAVDDAGKEVARQVGCGTQEELKQFYEANIVNSSSDNTGTQQ